MKRSLRWWLGALVIAPSVPFLLLGLWLMKMLPRQRSSEAYFVPIPPSRPGAGPLTVRFH